LATEVFSFATDAQRHETEQKFLACLAAGKPQHAIGVYPAADAASRAFYVLTLRPEADITQVLPGMSALQRQLDVVLLHQGILEPALGITAHAVASEANLTYEREAAMALAAVDRGFSAESRGSGSGDAGGDRRRSDAAEVHGLLSQAAERNHDVPRRGLENKKDRREPALLRIPGKSRSLWELTWRSWRLLRLRCWRHRR
jgi:hypothetical protein